MLVREGIWAVVLTGVGVARGAAAAVDLTTSRRAPMGPRTSVAKQQQVSAGAVLKAADGADASTAADGSVGWYVKEGGFERCMGVGRAAIWGWMEVEWEELSRRPQPWRRPPSSARRRRRGAPRQWGGALGWQVSVNGG